MGVVKLLYRSLVLVRNRLWTDRYGLRYLSKRDNFTYVDFDYM